MSVDEPAYIISGHHQPGKKGNTTTSGEKMDGAQAKTL